MDSVKTLLPKVLKKRGMYDVMMATHLLRETEQWIAVAAPDFLDAIHVKTFANGIITIEADNAIAMMALNPLRSTCIAHLQKILPECAVSQIKITRK